MSYLHHLFKANEILGLELASKQNLTFYLWLMNEARQKIRDDTFQAWYEPMSKTVDQKI
jgi:queuine tRNA-ribosyltransferase